MEREVNKDKDTEGPKSHSKSISMLESDKEEKTVNENVTNDQVITGSSSTCDVPVPVLLAESLSIPNLSRESLGFKSKGKSSSTPASTSSSIALPSPKEKTTSARRSKKYKHTTKRSEV